MGRAAADALVDARTAADSSTATRRDGLIDGLKNSST